MDSEATTVSTIYWIYQLSYSKHAPICCACLSTHSVTCLLQLINVLKWLSLVDHWEEGGVGGTEALKEDNTREEHEEENHPHTDESWSIVLTLLVQNYIPYFNNIQPVEQLLPQKLENYQKDSIFPLHKAQSIQGPGRQWRGMLAMQTPGWSKLSKHQSWTLSEMQTLLPGLFQEI